jgi:hypothetical protein
MRGEAQINIGADSHDCLQIKFPRQMFTVSEIQLIGMINQVWLEPNSPLALSHMYSIG